MKKVTLIFNVFDRYRQQELVNMLVTHVQEGKSVFTIVDEDEKNSLNNVMSCHYGYDDVQKKRLLLVYR